MRGVWRSACLAAATGTAALLSSLVLPSSTETAAANGDTRTLNLYHSHTGESIQATFRVNGAYDSAVLEKLNYFLRDWRNNDVTRMDPRLFDVIWEAYRTAGATQPIVIVSAYRSPQTNAMLRARSHAVAEHSQHILGRAMDTTMPGMPMARIREIGMRMQRGGVGWYPTANFVHLDVGGVRAWPRMSYDQLVRLFPDGKTVHIAADGRTLPRYEEARAEIASRGGVMSDVPQTVASAGGGLFAWLFGRHDEERGEEKEAEVASPQIVPPARSRGTEVALRANRDDTAGSAPADQASSHVVTGADKSSARVEDATPANRTAVADLSSAGSLHGAPAAEQDRDTATANSMSGKHFALSAPAPLPPQRPPLPSLKLAFATVPAPPARPASLTRVAALGSDKGQSKDMVAQPLKANTSADTAATTALNPLSRAANLPVVITQGPKDHPGLPGQVLAFAADTPGRALDAAAGNTLAQTASRSTRQQTMVTASLAPAKPRGLAAGIAGPSLSAPSILGPSFTGLRRAARIIPDALSNVPSSEYVSAFHAAASDDLDTNRFTGSATKPLAFAQDLAVVKESGKN